MTAHHMSPRETIARALYPMFYQVQWEQGANDLRRIVIDRTDKILAALRAQGHGFDTDNDMAHARAMAEAFNKRLYS